MDAAFIYAKIGPAGAVLAVVAVLGLFLSVKYLIYLLWMDVDFKKFFARVEQGEIDFKKEKPSRNPLRRIVTEIVVHHQHHSADLRSEVSYLFYRYFNRVKASMAVLRLISVISPLLGLMGTVLGIIKVFGVIGGSENGMIAQSDLALGIGEAMYTTVMGLVVTIPVLAMWYAIRLKVSGFQVMLMEYAYRAIGAADKRCPYGK